MNQNERNLAGFIDLLRKSDNNVGSFKKNEVVTYFLIVQNFFKNYVNENNEKYDIENPLFIKNEEAEVLNIF